MVRAPTSRSNSAGTKGSRANSDDVTRPDTAQRLLVAYREMYRARLVDDKTIVLYKQNKCHFQISGAGHEAVQVAAAMAFKSAYDWFYPYYRDMAFCGALGMTSEEFFLNAINKEADPSSHGRMMPMHYGSKRLNIVQQSSPTGTQYLQAVGCALSIKLQKLNQCVYVSSGEGACAQGDFHEALNWASRDKLPIVFLIQNNKYAISVHISEQLCRESVADLVRNYGGLESFKVDGTDFESSLEILEKARKRATSGAGPVLVEADVPRLQSHSISDNQAKYRTKEDIENEKGRCPLFKMRRILIDRKIATAVELDGIEKAIKEDVNAAAETADQSPDCDPARALDYTYVEPKPWIDVTEGTPAGPEVFLVDALNHALDEEMNRDPKMVIFGQDVAHGKGGVFTVTAGLTEKYGVDRVFNSQLAESSIAGVAIGLATHGMKPVAEIQFADYVWTAMMQIRNELAMMNYRSAGDFTCPAVIRIPVGGYIHGGAYHSQNIESTFAHFPGLFVVYPSNASDAKGLLKASIRGKDPVLFLEHKGLYRQVFAKGNEGDEECLVPLGKAKTLRRGDDLTIVTWGALVHKSMTVASTLAEEGYSIEVIDLRTIVPFDAEAVFESVKRTNRLLIAHEDLLFGGFGAEVAAQVGQECFQFLDAPVKRVGMAYAAAVPHSPALEVVVLPQTDNVMMAARELLSY